MIRQLDCPNVLSANIINLTQLFANVALYDESLKDASDMLLMGNYFRVILTILETLDVFSIALWHLCQPLNYMPLSALFKYVYLSTTPKCGLYCELQLGTVPKMAASSG